MSGSNPLKPPLPPPLLPPLPSPLGSHLRSVIALKVIFGHLSLGGDAEGRRCLQSILSSGFLSPNSRDFLGGHSHREFFVVLFFFFLKFYYDCSLPILFSVNKGKFPFFCFVWFNWSWQRVKFVSGPQLSNSIGFGNSIFLRVSALTPAMTNRSVAEPNQSPCSFRITSQYQLMQVTHQSTLKVILNTIDLLMKRKTGVRQPH